MFKSWRYIFDFWRQNLKIESFCIVQVGPDLRRFKVGIGVGKKYIPHTHPFQEWPTCLELVVIYKAKRIV